jgi:hypothetical protein
VGISSSLIKALKTPFLDGWQVCCIESPQIQYIFLEFCRDCKSRFTDTPLFGPLLVFFTFDIEC